MTKERKNELLLYLETEILKAKENAEKTDEASKFTMSGPSQSGDKYHAQNAADLAFSYANSLQELKKEIQGESEIPVDKVKPTTYLEVEYEDGGRLDFFLVENAVSMTRYLFISTKSPLGSSLLGKKAGDYFNYELSEDGSSRKFSGKIIIIE